MDVITDKQMRRDLKTLIRFIDIYCDCHHRHVPREVVELKTHNVTALNRGAVTLCSDCRKLLTHALVKRTHCPMDPKPQCKRCPVHCYHAPYRARIREVMKFSGRHLVMHGRLDYLLHLLF